jgi:hypothetical protein
VKLSITSASPHALTYPQEPIPISHYFAIKSEFHPIQFTDTGIYKQVVFIITKGASYPPETESFQSQCSSGNIFNRGHSQTIMELDRDLTDCLKNGVLARVEGSDLRSLNVNLQ